MWRRPRSASAAEAIRSVAYVRAVGGAVALGAVAARGGAVLTGTSQTHADGAAIDGQAVQAVDRGLGTLGRRHLNKTEAFGLVGVAVHHDLGGGHFAERAEVASEAGVGDGKGQVAHEDLGAQHEPFMELGRINRDACV